MCNVLLELRCTRLMNFNCVMIIGFCLPERGGAIAMKCIDYSVTIFGWCGMVPLGTLKLFEFGVDT